MIIVSVWSPKGGVGKTTITRNIAGMLSSEGKRVLICDADEQKSALDIHGIGNGCGFEVVEGIPAKVENRFDVILIDHAPGHQIPPAANVVIVPLTPSMPDIKSFDRAKTLLVGKKFFPVLNRVDHRRKAERDLAVSMLASGVNEIRNRNIYPRAHAAGSTVFHMKDTLSGVSAARAEIRRIWRHVLPS